MSVIRRTWCDSGVASSALGASAILVGILVFRGHAMEPADPPLAVATRAAREARQEPLFEELAAEATDVHFVHRLVPEHPLAFLYHSGYQCGGVCLGDVNGDNNLDALTANFSDSTISVLLGDGARGF